MSFDLHARQRKQWLHDMQHEGRILPAVGAVLFALAFLLFCFV